MSTDEPTIDLCACDAFVLWYVGDDGTPWCECSHEASEHIARVGTCTGAVRVLP